MFDWTILCFGWKMTEGQTIFYHNITGLGNNNALAVGTAGYREMVKRIEDLSSWLNLAYYRLLLAIVMIVLLNKQEKKPAA